MHESYVSRIGLESGGITNRMGIPPLLIQKSMQKRCIDFWNTA